MPPSRLSNYLRAHRKRAGLSQEQLAFLLGCHSGAKVSRYEQFLREPSLRTALAFEAIFHTPVRQLFAGIFDEVEQTVEGRARRLAQRLATRERKRRKSAM